MLVFGRQLHAVSAGPVPRAADEHPRLEPRSANFGSGHADHDDPKNSNCVAGLSIVTVPASSTSRPSVGATR